MKKKKKHCPICSSIKMVENGFGSLKCTKCGYMFIKSKENDKDNKRDFFVKNVLYFIAK